MNNFSCLNLYFKVSQGSGCSYNSILRTKHIFQDGHFRLGCTKTFFLSDYSQRSSHEDRPPSQILIEKGAVQEAEEDGMEEVWGHTPSPAPSHLSHAAPIIQNSVVHPGPTMVGKRQDIYVYREWVEVSILFPLL